MAKPHNIYKHFHKGQGASHILQKSSSLSAGRRQTRRASRTHLQDIPQRDLADALSEFCAELGGGHAPTRYKPKKAVYLRNGQEAVRALEGWEAQLDMLRAYPETPYDNEIPHPFDYHRCTPLP